MKANNILKQIGLGLAITSLAACPAGAIVAYNFGSATGNQIWNDTLGETFTVNSQITVTSLGAFDPSGFGAFTPEVAIYSVPVVAGVLDMGAASLVSPVAIFSDGSYTVSGNTASIGISPVTLGAGVYMIAAAGLPSIYNSYGAPTVVGLNTAGGAITYGSLGQPGDYYGANTTLTGGFGSLIADPYGVGPVGRYGAGTFEFTAVPEAQTCAVAGVAMLGLVFIGRKVIPLRNV